LKTVTDKFIPIPFAEGYGVSIDGLIINFKTGNITHGCASGHGYLHFSFQKNKIRKAFKVHKVVALIFIPNQNNYTEINHIDGNKHNNHYLNLEWCNRSQNVKHSFDAGLRKGSMFGKYGRDHNLSKGILQFTKDGEFVKEWGNAMEVQRETGFDDGSIGQCCKGVYKQSNGFVWKYK
jgi:hypothetical protein